MMNNDDRIKQFITSPYEGCEEGKQIFMLSMIYKIIINE